MKTGIDASSPDEVGGIGRRATALRISLYYTALFGLVGVVMPFFPVWLQSRGLTAAEIGAVMAAILWVRVAVNPVVAGWADRMGERKRIVAALAGLGFATGLLFPLAGSFWPILAVAMLHTALQGPIMPLGENLVLHVARARGLDYGRMRLWGSVAFIATSTGMGVAMEGRSESLIVWTMVGLLGLVFAATLSLPDPRPPRAPRGARPARRLLASPLFLLFLATAACNMASHAVLNAFATIHWRAAGIPEEMIGLLWSTGVVAEIAVFAFAARLQQRLGVVGLLALGAGAGALRWIGLGLTTDPALLFPLQALHAFTFGASHLGAMALIQRHVPAPLSASAQALYSSLGMGAPVGLATLGAGALYARLGGGAFLAMAGLSAASLIAAAALGRRWRGSEIAR